jgi:hypothetical protein
VVQPNHGNDEEEGGGPRVTKIVVIYMDEQDRT